MPRPGKPPQSYRDLGRGISRRQFRKFVYDEIIARDKTNLYIFWLKDKSLADLDNLPDPDILTNVIIGNMEVSLASFKEMIVTINGDREEMVKRIKK
ncbi:Type I restriction-modification system, DNA-methyltransferase subunit M [Methanosarcina siciliae T4/M]|uniref:Type I restriction-modification system, DNA-methyltransferase subunit M n=2 Tax=Methanosarcina siciliae TaxID=38027 RepID=A0A0E3PCA7_9EURY|nr:hypothetical protein [Methanosarcina siciliae]AKB27116.1 Type I restriction-modification system, DNA-methyltransferase subunit M [Methanosarcina siciliae T4/M]AKB31078.1 Type I restriction-modification system, DNA-methyltransferase subunit M [Methanosarcina siciliae HI350]